MTPAEDREKIPSPDDLATLLSRVALHEDKQAFAALFRFYAPRLKSFLAGRGFAENACEDLVQETMINVWRKASSFDPARAGASTWIFTIARNLGIDRRRREGRSAGLQEMELQEDVDPDPTAEMIMIARQSDILVRQALAGLPAEQAVIIRMSFFAENPQAEIARMLGIPLGTVKSRVRLALQRLRRTMEDRR